MIVTIEDIEAASGIEVPDEDQERVEFLIRGAVAAVEGYLGRNVPSPPPDAVLVVVTRMVARALTASPDTPAGMTSEMNVAVSFTRQRQFASGSQDGGVWLSSQDKLMLRPFKARRGVTSVPYRGMP